MMQGILAFIGVNERIEMRITEALPEPVEPMD